MSIQDDIFDVRDALKRKPEKAAFERICQVLHALEEEADGYNKLCDGLSVVRDILNSKYQGDDPA